MLRPVNQLVIQSPILPLLPILAIDPDRVKGRFDVQVDEKNIFVCSSSCVYIVVQGSNGRLSISVWKKATVIDVEEVLVGDPRN